jgi:hypothetical protein
MVVLWLAAPIAGSARHAMAMHPHYFVGVFPGQFVAAGVAVATIFGVVTTAARRVWPDAVSATIVAQAAAVLLLAVPQASFFWSYLDLVETHGPTRLYGVPLAYTMQAVANARVISQAHDGAPVYFLSYRQRDVLNYLSRPDLDAVVVDPPEGLLLPKDAGKGVVYVLASDDGNTADKDYRLVASEGAALRRLRWLGFAEEESFRVKAPDGYTYYRLLYAAPEQLRRGMAAFVSPASPALLANGMSLRGAAYPDSTKSGEGFDLATLWGLPNADLSDPYREHNIFVHLTDRNGRPLAQSDAEMPRYELWNTRHLLVAFHELAPPADWGPGQVWFDLGAYGRFDRREILWLDQGGKPSRSAMKIGPAIVRPRALASAPATESRLAFGDSLTLAGYTLERSTARAGEEMGVSLRWRAIDRPKGNYTISLQLLDASGRLAAQHDAPPVDGDYPTSVWQPNDELDDVHRLAIPPQTAQGLYSLAVLAYDSQTGLRLAVTGPDGVALGDHARLTTVEVK